MELLTVQTRTKDQVVDITEKISEHLRSTNILNGLCYLFVLHTTCCLTTADLDPGTDLDLLDALRQVLPALPYRHPHDPAHTPDHILSSMIGPAICIPIHQSKLVLGVWQRIILIELDGPRKRNISVTFLNH